MTLRKVYDGEDVPLQIEYTDGSDTAVATDAAPTITVTDDSGTEQVSGASMTSVDTGHYEHVWDTSAASGPGDYEVEISAEINSETKIRRDTIQVL